MSKPTDVVYVSGVAPSYYYCSVPIFETFTILWAEDKRYIYHKGKLRTSYMDLCPGGPTNFPYFLLSFVKHFVFVSHPLIIADSTNSLSRVSRVRPVTRHAIAVGMKTNACVVEIALLEVLNSSIFNSSIWVVHYIRINSAVVKARAEGCIYIG